MSSELVTCVVPTHNRPQFLKRLLRFYEQFSPGFSLLVIDSSSPSAAAENRECIENWQGTEEIEYQHFDLNLIDKCLRGLEQVRTPFTAFCADDDILFPNAVQECAAFLAADSRYASVMGRTAELRPKLPNWCARVLRGYSIENTLPFERCRQLASSWFTNFYAVYRTETLVDMYQITAANTDARLGYYIPEMLLSQLSVLRGGIKVLPMMYSLMERHGTNAGSGMRVGVRPQALALFEQFKACLVDQYVRSGVEPEVADRFVEDTYDYFREPDWSAPRRPRSTDHVIRQWLRSVHGAVIKVAGLWGEPSDRHRRFVRASDLMGCEPVWKAAVQLMRDFPLGIPTEQSALKRSA